MTAYPRAILHIDGDAFFASCEQARRPELRGKPVITGKERGIAASMSYEAKNMGVTRAMRLFEIKKICPQAVILPSDYETYSLLSKRLYAIVRRYTSEVEEYGIDECFADITITCHSRGNPPWQGGAGGVGCHSREGGNPIPVIPAKAGILSTKKDSSFRWNDNERGNDNYEKTALRIQEDLKRELGFTFSIGLAPNKVLAKVGSKWKKPYGFTAIPAQEIHHYLEKLPVEKIWGVGPSTSAFLNKQKIFTALDFARAGEYWVKQTLCKPFYEIWQELNGRFVLPLNQEEKTSYGSIQKMKTFTPPSCDADFVFSQLSKNIENACVKMRRYNLSAPTAIFFLRTQDFQDRGVEVKFARPTNLPPEILPVAADAFKTLFRQGAPYRSTGAVFFKLAPAALQRDLFRASLRIEKLQRMYEGADKVAAKYGKHTLFLGTSWQAHQFGAHLTERKDEPDRKTNLFLGETKRKRLNIPMLMGEI